MSDSSQASFSLGLVSTVGVLVPPGLFVSPVAGLLAIALGVADLRRNDAPGKSQDRALLGIALGLLGLLVSATLIFLFRRVIWHAIDSALIAP